LDTSVRSIQKSGRVIGVAMPMPYEPPGTNTMPGGVEPDVHSRRGSRSIGPTANSMGSYPVRLTRARYRPSGISTPFTGLRPIASQAPVGSS
jgi:hypothetical protein